MAYAMQPKIKRPFFGLCVSRSSRIYVFVIFSQILPNCIYAVYRDELSLDPPAGNAAAHGAERNVRKAGVRRLGALF